MLEAFGWERANEEGSHVTFKKPGELPLVVVKHGGRMVKRVYLDRICERLGLDTDMVAPTRPPLEHYLELQYPMNLVADPEGGYVVLFPDLPGCMTQVERLDEAPAMAEEARRLWIQTAYEEGHEIPVPSYPEEYSGRFVVRIPRSLHRSLVESAEREGVSLNQYVSTLLARGDAWSRAEQGRDRVVRPSACQPAASKAHRGE